MPGFSGYDVIQHSYTAFDLVLSRFAQAFGSIEEALADMESAQDELASTPIDFRGSVVPPVIDAPTFTGRYNFPEIPNAPTLTWRAIPLPVRPDIDISIPGIPDTPDINIADFVDKFNWAQNLYNRAVLENLRDRLIDFIYNGGTGLAAVVEQAIYDRDRARQEYIDEQRFEEVQNFFESRGNSMPSGQHSAAINRAAFERARMYEEISRSVMIKAAELEQENMRIAQEHLTKVETILTALHNAEEDRALEGEKVRITTSLEAYKAYLQAQVSRLEIHKATIEAIVAYIKANVAAVEARTQVYTADVAAYGAQVEAESKRLTTLVNVFENQVRAVAALIEGISELAKVDVAKYEAEGKIAIAQAEIELKSRTSELELVLKEFELRLERLKSIAAMNAQIVASAFASVNASASVSEQENRGVNMSWDETADVERVSTDNIHNFQE